uniref:Small ribosomal subunit protein uS4c n=1 Tax=Microrhizoidea pickettheapsiorum TaxID=2604950 RepID=A0A5B9RGR1_9CHLO|nr:ribosomal protein S4 [Microrhizoidea pickettheapsiorum]QEG77696.1 ribosomal protein S4 [Microrhizoidea pickettheapsiorum]
MKKIKLVRTYGPLPVLTKKFTQRETLPGQHGGIAGKKKRSQYGIRLNEKQKLRHNYALNESQFVRYIEKAKRSKQLTGHALLQLLENRLDTCIYREGFAPTILAARQLVSHRHILVNGKIVNIPSYQCQSGDIIQAKKDISHLIGDKTSVQMTRIEKNRPQIELDLTERLVVEYYSRK